MIPLLVAIAIAVALGWPLARLADPSAGAGEAYLIGIASCCAILALLSAFGIAWSGAAFIAVAAVVFGVAAFAARRRLRPSFSKSSAALLPVIALVLAPYVLFVTTAAPWTLDFVTNWGLKAHTFAELKTIDLSALAPSFVPALHIDYPLLVPLTFDTAAVVGGVWNDRWLGLFDVAWAAAALLALARAARSAGLSFTSSAIAIACVSAFAASPWVGMADGAFAAFVLAAVLALRHGLASDDRAAIRLGSILAGLAASTKIEGLGFLAAIVVAVVVAGAGRRLLALWPAFAIQIPWLLYRSMHRYASTFPAAGAVDRVRLHVTHVTVLLRALSDNPVATTAYWSGLLIAALALGIAFFRYERFALTVIAVQIASYIAAYFLSPMDIPWHVRWSWVRLVWQVLPLLTGITLLRLLPLAIGRQDHAERQPAS